MERYTTIDFETANRHPSSICAIGLCVVENNKIKKTFYSLVKPVPFNVEKGSYRVHHISQSKLKKAPTFDQVWQEISQYFENTTVVGHNISQDMLFLRATLDYYHLPYPNCNMACTFVLSKKLIQKCESFKLDGIANYLNLKFIHHHALEDALMCVKIIKSLKKMYNVSTLENLYEMIQVDYGKMAPKYYRNIYVSDISNNQEYQHIHYENINPNIYHHCICFDAISHVSIAQVKENIASQGGFVQERVNFHTNYLVTNRQKTTNNLIKAHQLIASGQDLKCLTYHQFLDLMKKENSCKHSGGLT